MRSIVLFRGCRKVKSCDKSCRVGRQGVSTLGVRGVWRSLQHGSGAQRICTGIIVSLVILAIGCSRSRGKSLDVTEIGWWQTSCDVYGPDDEMQVSVIFRDLSKRAAGIRNLKNKRGLTFDSKGIVVKSPGLYAIPWKNLVLVEVVPVFPDDDALMLSVTSKYSNLRNHGVIELGCWREIERRVKSAAPFVRIVGSPPGPELHIQP
jgi:hypothetical protein